MKSNMIMPSIAALATMAQAGMSNIVEAVKPAKREAKFDFVSYCQDIADRARAVKIGLVPKGSRSQMPSQEIYKAKVALDKVNASRGKYVQFGCSKPVGSRRTQRTARSHMLKPHNSSCVPNF